MGRPEGEVLAVLPVHAIAELGHPELDRHHHHLPRYTYAGQLVISLSRINVSHVCVHCVCMAKVSYNAVRFEVLSYLYGYFESTESLPNVLNFNP